MHAVAFIRKKASYLASYVAAHGAKYVHDSKQ